MAFVYKTDREINQLKISPTGEIGPGQYLPQGYIGTNKKISKFGFNSNTYRELKLKKNENPGPGSYEKDDKYKNFSEFLKEKPNKSPSLINSLELVGPDNLDPFAIIINKEKSKDIAFSSKEKRFRESPNIDNPGPSDYSENYPNFMVKNSIRKRKIRIINNKLKNANLIRQDTSPKNSFRHISIPSKNLCYGFEESANGSLIVKDDPDKDMRYAGEKLDCVGPGSYEFNNENWKKGGINWDKEKRTGRNSIYTNLEKKENENTRLENINDFEDLMNKNKNKESHFKEILNNNYTGTSKTGINYISDKNDNLIENQRNRMKKDLLFKHFIDKRQKLLDMKISKNLAEDDLFDRHILNQEPGPGYYSSENALSSFKPVIVPEKYQYFGSNSLRFSNSNNNVYDENVGPGYYFKDDNKFGEENNKNNLKENNYFFISANQRDEIRKLRLENIDERIGLNDIVNQYKNSSINNSPGPGSYDLESEKYHKKSSSNVAQFGSLQKRFNENNFNPFPGPGSYIGSTRVNSLNNFKFNVRPKKIIIKKECVTEDNTLLTKNNKRENIDNKSTPGVGSYNNEILHSVGYKVAKNVNRFNQSSAPFNSIQKRFKNNSIKDITSPNIGPGKYYKDDSKNKILQNQMNNSPPFNIGSERKILDDKVKILENGPGSYDLSSYFDWNKKSFNVQFI
jgi:hypothetical protein